ncbi:MULTISPECIES: hypothetical protein [Vibrio]|uniref:hypothetical protein n=1 Tax=Vibrio TaxID=662 RepID=UPI000C852424|nr:MULTISPECIES: hypothetical protein [Vibrio]PML42668.1 hypothetical protein BCT76_21835 [Vibrio tasmaniensis]PTP79019.1 hypothetical protein CWO00_07270 [Vibrio splendidus]
MKFIIFIVLTVLLLFFAGSADLEKITPWLIGVSFTVSIFSINFTFFGYQLSKYKPIYDQVSKRQWFHIVFLMVIPFAPLLAYLATPDLFAYVSLGSLPLLFLSSLDNAVLTMNCLNPIKFISDRTTSSQVNAYNSKLANCIKREVKEHEEFLLNKDKFQMPMHGFTFEPTILGLEESDIWDSLSLVNGLSLENTDHPTFKYNLNVALKTLLKSYEFKSGKDSDYRVDFGINHVSRQRFRAIISHVVEEDKQGVFLHTLAGELCSYLMQPEILNKPCSELTRAIASEAVWVAQRLLTDTSVVEPTKVLNTLHRVAELGIYRLENNKPSDTETDLDKHNIAVYAHDIKSLAVSALENGNNHFAYRCMETLSYLGCNSAKLQAREMVTSVFEGIIHIGRASRNLNIGCFWSRCLIPAESHAEEFLGHIVTWLVSDIKEDGSFFMKEFAEQAYSRLRGVQCILEPKGGRHPKFWVTELQRESKAIPHIEHESGMFGYCGELDYSDFNNLKEYKLYGFSPKSSGGIIRSDPIPLDL